MRPFAAPRGALPLLIAAAAAACGSEAPREEIGVGEQEIDLAALPIAYRTPQAMIQAMATGQLYERPPRCDGFSVRDTGSAAEADNWTHLARLANKRAGEGPVAVVTQAVAFDPAAGTVAFVSTPVGTEAPPFRSEWTLRASPDGSRIACVERVTIASAS